MSQAMGFPPRTREAWSSGSQVQTCHYKELGHEQLIGAGASLACLLVLSPTKEPKTVSTKLTHGPC